MPVGNLYEWLEEGVEVGDSSNGTEKNKDQEKKKNKRNNQDTDVSSRARNKRKARPNPDNSPKKKAKKKPSTETGVLEALGTEEKELITEVIAGGSGLRKNREELEYSIQKLVGKKSRGGESAESVGSSATAPPDKREEDLMAEMAREEDLKQMMLRAMKNINAQMAEAKADGERLREDLIAAVSKQLAEGLEKIEEKVEERVSKLTADLNEELENVRKEMQDALD